MRQNSNDKTGDQSLFRQGAGNGICRYRRPSAFLRLYFVLYKDHADKTELFHPEKDEQAKFSEEMTIVAEAVSKAFGAEKMNYELLGMGDAHLHWHLYPRRTGDIENYGNNGKGPVWCYPLEKIYSDDNRPTQEELERMKSKLSTEPDKLLKDRSRSDAGEGTD